MSIAGGFLSGFADGVGKKRDRQMQDRKLSVLEALAGNRTPPMRGADADAMAGSYTYDGKIGDRPMYAFNYFRQQGVPDEVAAGMVGNLMQESGRDINPAASGDNGNAFGAAQWNGPRMRAYMDYAKAKGVDPTDFDTQLEYLVHEGQTSERGAWNKIMAAKTPEEAALVASNAFWRPGVPANENRVAYARSVFNNRPARTDAAPAKGAAPEPGDWFRTVIKGAS